MEVKWIEHKTKRILLIDYTGIKMERDMLTHLNSVVPMLKDLNKGDELYALSDLTGCFVTPGFLDAAKKLEKEVFSQYKLKWAILGITGAKAILLRGFNLIAKNKLEPFNSKEEALDYLAKDK